MKIGVAAPFQMVSRLASLEVPAPATAAAPLPTTIDLTRQLKFGDSEVDEAGVVLVEMSVLVYEPLDVIRRAVETLQFDRCAVMDADRDRAADWCRLEPRASPTKPLTSLSAFTGSLGMSSSPAMRQFIEAALAGPGPGRPMPGPVIGHGLGPPPMDRATGLALAAALARVKSLPDPDAAPRVLAVLHDDNALIVFRGTSTWLDIGRDLAFWPAWAWPLRHSGFQRTWKEVKPKVDTWLAGVAEKLGRPPTIYLGGHSLGGAVATLAAVDLAETNPVARVVTLGSPRVGGWSFRKKYASGKAACAADGTARNLPAVTTRWVHGTDLIATLIPPPGPTVHVAASSDLRATDRLDIEAYFPSNLMDTTPLVNLVSRLGETPEQLGVRRQPGSPWTQDARRAAGQMGIWLAMALPWQWWARLFMPLVPLALEQFTRSGFQHMCRRYLGFMPPSALYRAMHPVAPRSTEPPLHVVQVE